MQPFDAEWSLDRLGEYDHERHEYFRRKEVTPLVESNNPDGPGRPGLVTQGQRKTLVDWLSRIHAAAPAASGGGPPLSLQSLFLAVNILDRFLFTAEGGRGALTDEGWKFTCLACLGLGSKYEDIQPPSLWGLAVIATLGDDEAGNGFWGGGSCRGTEGDVGVNLCGRRIGDEAVRAARKKIVAMEQRVLSALGYHLTVPTALTFLGEFIHRGSLVGFLSEGSDTESLCEKAQQILLRVLSDSSSLSHLPSALAAAALYCASSTAVTEGLTLSSSVFFKITDYQLRKLRRCVQYVRAVHTEGSAGGLGRRCEGPTTSTREAPVVADTSDGGIRREEKVQKPILQQDASAANDGQVRHRPEITGISARAIRCVVTSSSDWKDPVCAGTSDEGGILQQEASATNDGQVRHRPEITGISARVMTWEMTSSSDWKDPVCAGTSDEGGIQQEASATNYGQVRHRPEISGISARTIRCVVTSSSDWKDPVWAGTSDEGGIQQEASATNYGQVRHRPEITGISARTIRCVVTSSSDWKDPVCAGTSDEGGIQQEASATNYGQVRHRPEISGISAHTIRCVVTSSSDWKDPVCAGTSDEGGILQQEASTTNYGQVRHRPEISGISAHTIRCVVTSSSDWKDPVCAGTSDEGGILQQEASTTNYGQVRHRPEITGISARTIRCVVTSSSDWKDPVWAGTSDEGGILQQEASTTNYGQVRHRPEISGISARTIRCVVTSSSDWKDPVWAGTSDEGGIPQMPLKQSARVLRARFPLVLSARRRF